MIPREKVLSLTEAVTSALLRIDDICDEVTRYHELAQQTTSPEQLRLLSSWPSVTYSLVEKLAKKYFVVAKGISDIEKRLIGILVGTNAYLDRVASGEITAEDFDRDRAKSGFTVYKTLDQYVQYLETERPSMQEDRQRICRETARLDAGKAKIHQMLSKVIYITQKIEDVARI